MGPYLRAALVLLAIMLVSGLLGFGVIRSPLLFGTRMVFFAAGPLFVALLMVGLVRR